MWDMAHPICLIKLYQITMRKKFRIFVSDYLKPKLLNLFPYVILEHHTHRNSSTENHIFPESQLVGEGDQEKLLPGWILQQTPSTGSQRPHRLKP